MQRHLWRVTVVVVVIIIVLIVRAVFLIVLTRPSPTSQTLHDSSHFSSSRGSGRCSRRTAAFLQGSQERLQRLQSFDENISELAPRSLFLFGIGAFYFKNTTFFCLFTVVASWTSTVTFPFSDSTAVCK